MNRTNVVALAGSSEEIHKIIAAKLWSGKPRSVIHLDSSTKDVISNDSMEPKFKEKLQIFVVTADSPTTLRQVLNDIKKSRWWNHMALYLILGWPKFESECSNAQEMLWAAWKMDILNAKFMCLDRMKKILIYTYNPYTSHAPNSWKLVKTYREKNIHPWTLFIRNHQAESAEKCRNLDFDKTNNVGGYKVRFTELGHKNTFQINSIKKNVSYSFSGFEGVLFETLLRYMKAVPERTLLPGQRLDGTFIKKVGAHITHEYLENKTSDMSANYWSLVKDNATYVYPFMWSGLRGISQFSDETSQLEKLWSVFDSYSRLGVLGVSLITVIFLKYYLGQSLILSILNYWRLICNGALLRLPNNVPTRIFLSSIFLFFINFQGIYQGKLSSLLTKVVYLPNVDTMQDLVHGSYTIYGTRRYHDFFRDHQISAERYVEVEEYDCTKYVLRNSLGVCIRNEVQIMYDASKLNLHLSKHRIVKLYMIFSIRDDWPLEQRINTFYRHMVESGLIEYLYKKSNAKPLYDLELREYMYENQNFKAITLKQLMFIFVILGIGLACATVSFIVEYNIHRMRRNTQVFPFQL